MISLLVSIRWLEFRWLDCIRLVVSKFCVSVLFDRLYDIRFFVRIFIYNFILVIYDERFTEKKKNDSSDFGLSIQLSHSIFFINNFIFVFISEITLKLNIYHFVDVSNFFCCQNFSSSLADGNGFIPF